MERVEDFAVSLDPRGGRTTVVRVSGELDLATAPALEQALEPVPATDRLVLDLTGCTFLDSSAIRVLAARARVASEAGGSVAVVAADSGIRRVLEIAALDTVLELHETLDAAL